MCQRDTFIADESIVSREQLADGKGVLAAKRASFCTLATGRHIVSPESYDRFS
jgi:hypothetical protein